MRRVVVGAHYGLRDWLAQRITAVVMVAYTLILMLALAPGPARGFAEWKGLFATGWMRVSTLLFGASLAWHVWVGIRDVLMDYVKLDGLRLALQVLTLLLIAGYLGWLVQILWR